jgi:uncharacterized protein (TIGR02246 family)
MGLQALLTGLALVLPAADAGDDVAKEVERAVRTIQMAFNKGDADALKGLMTEDHVTILSYAQFASAADLLKALSDWQYTEYKMDGLKVKTLGKDVALVSYQAVMKGTYKGKPVPSPVQVSEVWVKRDGKWLEASYQETPVDRK